MWVGRECGVIYVHLFPQVEKLPEEASVSKMTFAAAIQRLT